MRRVKVSFWDETDKPRFQISANHDRSEYLENTEEVILQVYFSIFPPLNKELQFWTFPKGIASNFHVG